MSLPEAARGSQFAPRGVPAGPCYAGRLVSAVEAQPDLARQLVRIMRLALEEIAVHQCLDRSAEGDTCAEGDECAVCLATVALQDVDTEERAESRRREADEREKRARFAALGSKPGIGHPLGGSQ